MVHRLSHVRFLVLGWYCLLAMLAYVHRSCLSVPSKRIETDLGISPDDMAWVLSMFLWGYAAAQLPSGFLGDRFGCRFVVPILVVLWSAANGFMALAGGVLMLTLCRFAMGAAQAGIFPCAVLSFSRWFPRSERGLPNGLLAAFMSVGGVIGSALTAFLLQYISWQTIMVAFALPGILAALGFYFWFRDYPQEHPGVSSEELAWIQNQPLSPEPSTIANPAAPIDHAAQLFSARWFVNMTYICAQQFCRAAGYIFYLTWFPRFLQEGRGLTETQSGYYTTLPLLGVVVGSTLGGAFSDWLYRRTGSLTWSRQGLAIVSLFLTGSLMGAAFFTPEATPTILLMTAGSIFAGLCGPASYAVTIDLGGKHVATVFSVMNMSGNIGAALLPLAVRRVEKIHGWDDVLLFLACLYFLALLCWLGIRMPRKTPLAA